VARLDSRPVAVRFLAALLFATTASAQQLSHVERVAASAVDANNGAALVLLERVVNINSGTMNLVGVRAVGDIFAHELQSLGFTTRWENGAAVQRAGHLVAEHRTPGPKILLIGHLDTVFEPASPFQKFRRLDDSTATGPGIIDMKGGDVIIVYALRALRDAGLLDRMNVTVVMDGDEEAAGRPLADARKALIDAARGAAYAIGFEDGPGDPRYGVIARRGATNWKLTTTGYPGHASQIFHDDIGAGAIFEASRILNAFREKLSAEQYLAFSPGLAVGGSATTIDSTWTSGTAAGKTNVVAGSMTITGDMRTISPEQLSRTQATMREIVAANLPKTTANITFDDGYPPLAPTDGNRRLLAMYDEASRALGFFPVQPVDPARAGAADVAFIAGIVPMIIDGVGLSGHDDHSDKETADLRMLPVQTKRAAVLLSRLAALRP
jgi:glutamate carboxypeptidase